MAAIPFQGSVTKQVSSSIPTPESPTAPPQTVPSQPETVEPHPDLIPSQSAPGVSGPSAISGSVTDLVLPPFPLNHARILYDNLLFNYSSITISSGTGTTNLVKPNTWERWNFTHDGNQAFVIEIVDTIQMDTICIGSHNLGDLGCTVEFYYDIDVEPGGFVKIGEVNPTNNDAIMLHLDTPLTTGRIQVNLTGGNNIKGYVGYVSAGIALQMQRPFFGGHTPITDADNTRYYSNKTESGNIIGQQIRSQGYQTKADWKNINDNWYRTYFTPFKQTAKQYPFFFAWNLLEYPNDVGLCRISNDIQAPYGGQKTLRSISIDLLGV